MTHLQLTKFRLSAILEKNVRYLPELWGGILIMNVLIAFGRHQI